MSMEAASLYYAVVNNNVAELERLLREGADADVFYEDDMDFSSTSLMHVCCGKAKMDCLK